MKTEMKKVYVYVREQYGVQNVEVSSEEFHTTFCSDITETVSAPLCEMEISVPCLDSQGLANPEPPYGPLCRVGQHA